MDEFTVATHSGYAKVAKRRIVGFRQDDHGDWIAELECGHAQHVRHDPPWTMRPWVTTAGGRADFWVTSFPAQIAQPPCGPQIQSSNAVDTSRVLDWAIDYRRHSGRIGHPGLENAPAPDYRARLAESRRERLFLAAWGFPRPCWWCAGLPSSSTTISARSMTFQMGGRHVHHLVWGILLLLITGMAGC